MEMSNLRIVALFENLVPGHLKLMAGIVEETQFSAGETIFSDGDSADSFYFICKGKVRISKMIPGMGEEALAILEPGGYFGEMALIDGGTRSADAIANTAIIAGKISKEPFEDLLFMHKDLAYDLLWTLVRTLSGRVRESNEKMRAFLAMSQF
ncbi:MAG: cyclic nucleotide-binding domain-containing protein [Deltaproteobacteria bacterium]|nr:cyclic nucleotide-binding domain-containing protein [Deltaproteobacteria bacterium]